MYLVKPIKLPIISLEVWSIVNEC